MVSMIYTLKKKYKDKKIYIWNINRDSMIIFTKVAFRGIDIQGFVSPQREFVGETYMNRKVVIWEKVEQEDSIILVSDQVPKSTIAMLPNDKVVYWMDALEFNDELRQKKIIVYGIGEGAKQIEKVLQREGVYAELYCVTKKIQSSQMYNGRMVIEATELERYDEYAVIISVGASQYRQEIMEELIDFKGQVYVENIIIGEIEILHINLIQSIERAIRKNKKVFLYSKKSRTSKLLEEILNIYEVPVCGYIYGSGDERQNIESVYSLAYEGISDKLLIINEECPKRLIEARENIELAGFSLEEGNYTGIQWYTRGKEMLLQIFPTIYDTLVGYSNLFTAEKSCLKLYGKPGWKIYGKEEAGRVKILVLGGSTSAEVWYSENWVSKFYDRLNRQNIKVVIYNGAHEGNDIVDEILRLLRDVYVLKPQIVISMSGVNNTCYKDSGNLFNEEYMIGLIKSFSREEECCSGVDSDEPLYSFWSRNVKVLKLISEFHGANFFGFLQPMNITMNTMNLWEKSSYELEAHIIGARNFAQSACNEDGYVNLMRLFEHRDEMYIDSCHYTDKAHGIIADQVYEKVITTIISQTGGQD